jgi:hypothetical protein
LPWFSSIHSSTIAFNDGEHGQQFLTRKFYCGEKLVALVCDDQLFVKPTLGGKAILGEPIEVPPYPGTKPYYLIRMVVTAHSYNSAGIAIAKA